MHYAKTYDQVQKVVHELQKVFSSASWDQWITPNDPGTGHFITLHRELPNDHMVCVSVHRRDSTAVAIYEATVTRTTGEIIISISDKNPATAVVTALAIFRSRMVDGVLACEQIMSETSVQGRAYSRRRTDMQATKALVQTVVKKQRKGKRK